MPVGPTVCVHERRYSNQSGTFPPYHGLRTKAIDIPSYGRGRERSTCRGGGEQITRPLATVEGGHRKREQGEETRTRRSIGKEARTALRNLRCSVVVCGLKFSKCKLKLLIVSNSVLCPFCYHRVLL